MIGADVRSLRMVASDSFADFLRERLAPPSPSVQARPRPCDRPSRDYCDPMKNITVSLDDDTYRNALMRAAELGTSVSALVRRFLSELGSAETDFQQRKRRERELRQRVPAGFQAADNLTRDQVHERVT